MPLPNRPKLHLNENLSPRLAEQLRRYGFDVTSSQESGLLAEPDSEQLTFASAEHRAILTFNVGDFVTLHDEYMAAGKEHWGIILSTREPIGLLLHRLLHLLNALSANELKNQVHWLNEFK